MADMAGCTAQLGCRTSPWDLPAVFLGEFTQNLSHQGLVNVPWLGYIGHHLIVAIKKTIYLMESNGWVMWPMGTWLMTQFIHIQLSQTGIPTWQIIPITQQALGHVGTAELDERSRWTRWTLGDGRRVWHPADKFGLRKVLQVLDQFWPNPLWSFGME